MLAKERRKKRIPRSPGRRTHPLETKNSFEGGEASAAEMWSGSELRDLDGGVRVRLLRSKPNRESESGPRLK